MSTKDKILTILKNNQKITTLEIAKHFGISRQYANALINELTLEGAVIKIGKTRATFYVLPETLKSVKHGIKKRKYKNIDLKEHLVYAELQRELPYLMLEKENVESIFSYAFSEMLNNAMDHSKSKSIEISIGKTAKGITFIIRDYGIGVFRNIMNRRKLSSEIEAIQDLLKGKITTQPHAHTGEGIFFTSKVADLYILDSYGYRLMVDNNIKDIFIKESTKSLKGTEVSFYVSSDSNKHLNDVFKKYQTGIDFDKTEIMVRLYTSGTVFVSRSQAKRILVGLEKFNSITLDFAKVPTIGQAFADEIFRVYQNKHPNIKLVPINMEGAVLFMFNRVKKGEHVPQGQLFDLETTEK